MASGGALPHPPHHQTSVWSRLHTSQLLVELWAMKDLQCLALSRDVAQPQTLGGHHRARFEPDECIPLELRYLHMYLSPVELPLKVRPIDTNT